MRTVRRLYFYTVAFISFEVVLWGLIGLLRSILTPSLGSSSGDALARALSLILIGVPIFALHWLWAQRVSAADAEEHSAMLRATFLYGILFAVLIPIAHNLFALIDRAILTLSGLDTFRAVLGGGQSWTDNGVAVFLNGIAAWYFIGVLRRNWASLSDNENFADIRRIYRYAWVLYSLLAVVFGLEQILRYMLYNPAQTLGVANREELLNGLSLLLVSGPIWYMAWKTCQAAIFQRGEGDSNLRLAVLYLLSFGGVLTVLSSVGIVIDLVLRGALGEPFTKAQFLRESAGSISIAVPFGIIWLYFGQWLRHDVNILHNESRRDGLRRLYNYVLAFAGLVTSTIGLIALFNFIIDVLIAKQIWGADLRMRISSALAALLVGLPLWLTNWRPQQVQALSTGGAGGFARRSVVRKTYIYLILFASVIGGMISAVTVAYRLLQAALGSSPLDVVGMFDSLQVLVVFALLLTYHFYCLRSDGSEMARALLERHEKFGVLVFERGGSGFGETVRASLGTQAQGLPVTVLDAQAAMPKEAESARALVLSSDVALNPPEALHSFLQKFDGQRVIVEAETEKTFWVGAEHKPAEAAAVLLRQLSEGQEVRPARGATGGWRIVIYIFAALFALELLLILLALGISSLIN